MLLFLNILLARISLLFALLLTMIWLLRIWGKNGGPAPVKKMNRYLRSMHKELGVALMITALIHGLLSSQKVWTLNVGTLNWIAAILLGVTWMYRRKLKQPPWISWHRLLTVVFVSITVWHIINVGGFQKSLLPGLQDIDISREFMIPSTISVPSATISPSGSGNPASKPSASNPNPSSAVQETIAPTQASSIYRDGVYTGTGVGYNPDLVVKVTIKNDMITKVQIVSHNEVGSNHYSRAMTQIPKAIINAQSPTVDAITGATYTSNGIMQAVTDALSKAKE